MERTNEIRSLSDDELRAVRGGRSFWGTVKAGATWVKNHVVATLHSIGIKGTF
jgi:hypothetical protein